MDISVILTVYNSVPTLSACLNSLINQTNADYEIIVIDDGSTDNPSSILKQFSQIKTAAQPHLGPAAARNFGASMAAGAILVFIDADMTFAPNFLTNLVAPIKLGACLGTFTTSEQVSNWDNAWARCWNFEYLNQITQYRVPQHQTQAPVFRAILKSAFNRVGGFDRGGYDDDHSLAIKLAQLAINAPKAVIAHHNPGSLSRVFFQAAWVASRRYKYGEWGRAYALFRANLIFSIFTGCYKMLRSHELTYPIFKIVYNLGLSYGIIKIWITRQYAK